MALFGSKKNTKAAPKAAAPKQTASTNVAGGKRDLTSVIKHARITEKASMAQASGVYVFDIATSATKRDVSQAVFSIYKVSPRAVRIVNVRAKSIRSMRTGKVGAKGGGKKAYVYLKQGETINL